MKTIKEVKLLHTEASKGWGGQEIRVFTELIEFKKLGFWTGLAAHPESKIFKMAFKHGISVFPIKYKKNNFKNVLEVIKLLKSLKIDILHTHSSWDSWVGAIAKLFCPKVKLVRTRHLSTPIKPHFLNKFLYCIAPDRIITTGEAIKNALIKTFNLPSDKVTSIPTGVDLNKFNLNKVKPVLPKRGFLIGSVGVLRIWKGHSYLIEAFSKLKKELPSAYLFIVGDGPQRKNLVALVKKLKLDSTVFLLGHRSDVENILASLDLVVHPSTGHEGVPQVILQALALKRPVIATSVGSIPEVIKDKKTGILVPPKDVNALQKAIKELYENLNLRTQIAEAGYKFVKENYSLEVTINKTLQVYQSLL